VATALSGREIPAPEIFDAVVALRVDQRHGETGEHERPRSRPPRRLGKPLRWVAGIAGAALIALVINGVFPNVLGQLFDGPKIDDGIHRGPDIITSESMYYPDGANVPMPTVVPGSYRVPAELVKEMSRPMAATSKNIQSQLRQAAGVVDVGALFIRVILQGNRREPVSVLGISPANLRRSVPLNGVLFDIGAQGEASDIQLGFNLDKAFPQALKVDEPDRMTNQPFFKEDTISLPDGQRNILVIQVDTDCYSASFDLSVQYMVGNTSHTELITDHGKPFQVSAFRFAWDGRLSYQQDFELQGNFSVTPEATDHGPAVYGAQLQAVRACPYLSAAHR
jgi:hypothetical protein